MTGKSSKVAMIALLTLGGATSIAQAAANDVILVQGAFVDATGWRAVSDILVAYGYNVSIAQLPLTSLDADVAAVQRILKRQDGPVVLVGHSYGGVVISVAGNDPKVEALVYVAAFQPDAGESLATVSTLAPQMLAEGTVTPSEDGFLIIDPAKFHDTFAADLPTDLTDFMAVSQGPASAETFSAVVETAAWREKPSWAVVATQDMAINPDLQRVMYERAGTTVTEVEGSHAVYMSQPQAVADVIVSAAQAAK